MERVSIWLMKTLRKWSRILHRDIGYFFIGTTLIYGLSGIALNHMNDWNPNYKVEIEHFQTKTTLTNSAGIKEDILQLFGLLFNIIIHNRIIFIISKNSVFD